MSKIIGDLDDDALQLRSEALWGLGLLGGVFGVVALVAALFGA